MSKNATKSKLITCLICGMELRAKGLNPHILRTHNINSKIYYDTYIKSSDEGLCIVCNLPTSFINMFKGYRTYCSRSCCANHKNLTEQKKIARAEFYKSHPEKVKEREEKRIKTETDNPSIRIEKASKVKDWYKNNPEKVKEKSQKMVETKINSIDENGLNIYQRTSQKISIAKRNFHKKSKDLNTTNVYFLYIINHLKEPIIKIGITNDLKRRLRDIKTDFGESEIIFNIKSSQNKIDELETYLHDYFNEYCKVQPKGRGRTEWFDECILEEAKDILTISSKELSHTIF